MPCFCKTLCFAIFYCKKCSYEITLQAQCVLLLIKVGKLKSIIETAVFQFNLRINVCIVFFPKLL